MIGLLSATGLAVDVDDSVGVDAAEFPAAGVGPGFVLAIGVEGEELDVSSLGLLLSEAAALVEGLEAPEGVDGVALGLDDSCEDSKPPCEPTEAAPDLIVPLSELFEATD